MRSFLRRTGSGIRGLALAAILLLLSSFAAGAQVPDGYDELAPAFERAYAEQPRIPRGLLEAIAFKGSFFHNLQPKPDGREPGPRFYGPMGLIADRSGLFNNTLAEVAALSGLPLKAVRTDPATNVLAFARAFAARRAQLGIRSDAPAAQIPVIVALSGFKTQRLGISYPLDHYVDSLFRLLADPANQRRFHAPAYDVDLAKIFGAKRLAELRAAAVDLAGRALAKATDDTGGPGSVALAGGDDPGATWMPAGCDDVKTFDRGGGPSHIAIETTESSFERALEKYLNCNRQDSPHYLISAAGEIVQLVREARASYHLGSADDNRKAIGIAHEGRASLGGFSPALLAASAGLVQRIAARTGIPATSIYTELGSSGSFPLPDCIAVKGGDQFAGSGNGPGAFWPWAGYYQAVNGQPPPFGVPDCPAVPVANCSGFIADDNASPFGNGFYADGTRRVISILGPPDATAIQLDFESLAMASGDWFYLYDGGCTDLGHLLGAWSGGMQWGPGPNPVPFAPPTSIQSHGNQLTVETRTDCAGGAPGFSATWTSLRSDGTPACCSVPHHFRVTDRRPTGVTLAWNAVTGAQDYKVEWKRSFDAVWGDATTVTTTTAMLEGLVAGTTYNFRLSSHCGGTDYSNFTYENGSTCRAGGDPGACTECLPPLDLHIDRVTASSIKINWSGVAGASGYHVQYIEDFPPPPPGYPIPPHLEGDKDLTDTKFVLEDLKALTSYTFEVRTICGKDAAGHDILSSPQTVSEATGFCLDPTAYPNGSFETIWEDFTKVKFRWTNGGGVPRYEVRYKKPEQSWDDPNLPSFTVDVGDPDREVYKKELFPFEPNQDYAAEIRSVCSASAENMSGWSAPIPLRTHCRAPGEVTHPDDEDPPISIAPRWNDAVATWGETEGHTYRVEIRDQNGGSFAAPADPPQPVPFGTYPLLNLTTGHGYDLRVKSLCLFGNESAWAEASFATQCVAPGPLRNPEATEDSLQITWPALRADRFRVSWKPVGSGVGFDADNIHGSNTAYDINHFHESGSLDDCTDYEVHIQSFCPVGGVNGLSADEHEVFRTRCAPCLNPMIRHGDGCGEWFIVRGDNFGSDVRWATQTRLSLAPWQVELRECADFDHCSGPFFDLGGADSRSRDKSCGGGTNRHFDYYAAERPIVQLGHYYEFRARYQCANGNWSRPKGEVYIIVPAEAKVSSVTPTTVTVSWQPVPDATGYTVAYGLPDQEVPNEMSFAADARSAMIPNLTTGQPYEIEVSAVLPNGLTIPASLTATPAADGCGTTLTPSSASLGSDAASGNRFTVGSACNWTASTTTNWITMTGGTSGSGAGQVIYSVVANPTTSARTGTITVGGKAFTVTQAGIPCGYTVDPLYFNEPGGGSQGRAATLSAPAACSWNASSHNGWITVRSASVGAGAGSVVFDVAANGTGSSRVGSLTVAGQTVTVYQEACAFTLQPADRSFSYTSDSDTLNISGPGGCPWTAISTAPWITLTSTTSGTGSGAVSYSVSSNTTTTWPTPRVGNILVGGQSLTVTQSGQPSCPNSQGLSCDPLGFTSCFNGCYTQSGATKTVYVWISRPDCDWTPVSDSPWIHVTGVNDPGSNPRSFTYTVDPNGDAGTRVGSITTNGLQHRVTQVGSSVAAGGRVTDGSGNGVAGVAITFGSLIPYSAPGLPADTTTDSQGNWGQTGFQACKGTFAQASKSGYVFSPNRRGFSPGEGGADFSTASGGGTTLVPANASVAGGASSGNTLQVTSSEAWTAFSNNAWITVTSGASGSGTGNVTYSVDANPNVAARTGSLTVAGQTFPVTQQGGSPTCTFAISPTGQSLPIAGGSGSVGVTAGPGCSWTAASNATWLSVTEGASGSGNATVGFTATGNGGNGASPARTGTLTVAGQTFTVTQAGQDCAPAFTPAGSLWSSSGGLGSVAVTIGTGCVWTAVSSAAWLTFASGTSGSGNATVGYSVAANPGPNERVGTLTIGGQAFSVSQSAPVTVPAAPSTLVATVLSNTQVKLAWKDNSANETGFTIERKSGTGDFTAVGSAGANTTTWTDTGLTPNTAYTYRVRATNSAGSSAPSNEVAATTPK